MNKDYSQNNPLGGSAEVYDIETEKELIKRSEQKDNKLKNMELSKKDFVLWSMAVMGVGIILGRLVEAIAIGNIQF